MATLHSLPCSLSHQSQCIPTKPTEIPAATRPHSVYSLTKQFGCSVGKRQIRSSCSVTLKTDLCPHGHLTDHADC